MPPCHCGSGEPFEKCCGPVINGAQPAATAEALMRSRYSAYVEHAIDYLGETLHPKHRSDWDREATRRWSAGAVWHGLDILDTEAGQPGDTEGIVEFVARFDEDGVHRRHHERSRFRYEHGRWFYVDGDVPKPITQRHEGPKPGRNDPCPCGSGRKYKKCCGA